MRSDAEIQRDVYEHLKWDPRVNEADVGVAVKNGVVTLTGTVPLYAEKAAAEEAAKRTLGVKAVAEAIAIKPTGTHVKTDAEIADLAYWALDSNVWVPSGVKATVEDGWVTLTGQVRWNFQRTAAVDAVRHLAGVKGVTNAITLKSGKNATDIKERIESALERNARTDARSVKVGVQDGLVTLSGSVRSWAEKDEAASAACDVPGVLCVENNIKVNR